MSIRANQKTGKVTSEDVAKLAGVSRWTVSRAFTPGKSVSKDVRKRVLETAEKLGYKPNLLARSLSTNKTQFVAVVVDNFYNPNMPKMLNILTERLQSNGLRIILLNLTAESSVDDLVTQADQLQVNAVIFLGVALPKEFISIAHKMTHIPLVLMYRDCLTPEPVVLNTDDFSAGQEIASLLINQGATRFAYFSGAKGESTTLRRSEGYESILVSQGHHIEQTFSIDSYDQRQAYHTFKNYIEQSSADERIDACFCENDAIALGVLDVLKEHQLEHEIAIVGFDDVPLAGSSSYQLTTYSPPFDAFTELAIQAVLREQKESVFMRGELVIRNSHRLDK